MVQRRPLHVATRAAYVLFASFLALLTACAADPGTNTAGDDTGRDRPGTDAGPADAGDGGRPSTDTTPGFDAPVDIGSRLEFVSEQYQRLSFNARLPLRVRYVTSEGDPIANARVSFDYDELDARGSALLVSSAQTDDEGIAEVELIAGDNPASFSIDVSVNAEDNPDPLQFVVDITAKEAADYVFEVFYGADRPLNLDTAEVFLFNDRARCAEFGGDPDEVLGAFYSFRLRASSNEFDPYAETFEPSDIPIMTAAVVATNGDDAVVAYGCNDGPFIDEDGNNVAPGDVEIGENTTVQVYLNELFPDIRGRYDQETQFDTIELLPPDFQDIVRYVGDFFSSPGSVVVELIDDVFSGGIPAPFDTLVAGAIDALLDAVLPPEVQQAFDTGADVYEALQNLRFQGEFIFYDDPDAFGRLGECNEFIVDRLIVNFDTIEDQVFDLRGRGLTLIEGNFTGRISVTGEDGLSYRLSIDPFEIDVNWGELLLFLLEEVILPAATDGRVDSISDYVRELVDCEQIAADIGWDPIADLCDTALTAAVEGFTDILIEQTINVGGSYQLATVDGATRPADAELLTDGIEWAPCALGLDTADGAFEVNTLGGPGIERCVWDARLVDTLRQVPALFYGESNGGMPRGTCD